MLGNCSPVQGPTVPSLLLLSPSGKVVEKKLNIESVPEFDLGPASLEVKDVVLEANSNLIDVTPPLSSFHYQLKHVRIPFPFFRAFTHSLTACSFTYSALAPSLLRIPYSCRIPHIHLFVYLGGSRRGHATPPAYIC